MDQVQQIVEVVKYPEYMTGKMLRKKLGIVGSMDRRYAARTYKVCAKFLGIKRASRLTYLKKMAKKVVASLTYDEMRVRRAGFNGHKLSSLPLSEKAMCFCCPNQAVLRHHVITLANGGRNKRNNIVPLCNDCHCKVHPHMHKKKTPVGGCLAAQLFPKNNGPLASYRPDEKVIFVAKTA